MSDWEDEYDENEKKDSKQNNNDDWENEMDDEVTKKEKEDFAPTIELESEELIKQEIVKKEPTNNVSNAVDYEKKYYERNKEKIEAKKEIMKAVEGIKDEQLRVKKILELERLQQAAEFMSVEEEEENKKKVMQLEKDFIQLAQKSCALINEANKPNAFTFSYLKCCLDSLLGNLNAEKISDLLKIIKIVFNKKLKEEGNKKKSKKPNVKFGKNVMSDNKKGVIYDDLKGYDYYEEEEEYDDVLYE